MPTVVGVGASAAGTGNITPAYPAGYTAVADDVAITFIETTSETITPPTNWVVAASIPVASGTVTRLTAIWRRLTASEAAPTITTTANHKIGRMIVVSGCRTSGNPYEAAPASTELVADTSVSIPGATTTNNNVLCLYAFGTGQDNNSTTGATGWADASLANVAERMDNWTTQGAGGGFAMASGEKATAGATGAMTATLSLTANFKTLMMIALVGASGSAVTGTAAGSFTFAGTAAGVPGVVGTAASTVTVGVTALGVPGVVATADATFTFTGTGSGSSSAPPVEGQAAGTYTFGSTALGVAGVVGQAVAAFSFGSTASGVSGVVGQAVASLTFGSTGQGVPGVVGAAVTGLTFGSTAQGIAGVVGQAAAALALTGTAIGQVAGSVQGQALGAYSFGSAAAGVRGVDGQGAAAFAFAAAASGESGQVPAVEGQASGAYTFTGTAAGQVTITATAQLDLTITATASGTKGVNGQAAAALTFGATAVGFGPGADVTGVASGAFTFLAEVVIPSSPGPPYVSSTINRLYGARTPAGIVSVSTIGGVL
jgi:hypothetical protein